MKMATIFFNSNLQKDLLRKIYILIYYDQEGSIQSPSRDFSWKRNATKIRKLGNEFDMSGAKYCTR